ncbi:MAG: hypothetical protein GX576_14070 [Thauera phenolivorans]|uniref:Uncharacterized protein n=1 Tax=Thauera phenolivorans TaxID=1792543 RepID=A0A7X7LYH3_9RHOO|nr:hypothetical protein [Thauera phenolivorans]NLF55494.1 hypothetical protein [Thauera phenolivorans]
MKAPSIASSAVLVSLSLAVLPASAEPVPLSAASRLVQPTAAIQAAAVAPAAVKAVVPSAANCRADAECRQKMKLGLLLGLLVQGLKP